MKAYPFFLFSVFVGLGCRRNSLPKHNRMWVCVFESSWLRALCMFAAVRLNSWLRGLCIRVFVVTEGKCRRNRLNSSREALRPGGQQSFINRRGYDPRPKRRRINRDFTVSQPGIFQFWTTTRGDFTTTRGGFSHNGGFGLSH